MVHRIVVLPDYQGIGIAKFMLDNIGEIYKKRGFDLRLKTSSSAMKKALEKNAKWLKKGATQPTNKPNGGMKSLNKTLSQKRLTFNFKYKGT